MDAIEAFLLVTIQQGKIRESHVFSVKLVYINDSRINSERDCVRHHIHRAYNYATFHLLNLYFVSYTAFLLSINADCHL